MLFENKGKEIKFVLRISDNKVIKEELTVNGELVLKRGANGKGKIRAEKEGKQIDFQTPQNELASNARRDSIQHPFFEDIFAWADTLSFYQFGTPLGKDTMIVFQSEEDLEKSLKADETGQVVAMFRKGSKAFKKVFLKNIIRDMKIVGYDLEDVGIAKPTSFISDINLMGLYVKEKDVSTNVDQIEISQGMFRALSLIIQINYLSLLGQRSCILIDDIGEGLDYDRSTNLINLLIKKSEEGKAQLIMSTNDRFVMNNVDLKYWSIIQRDHKGSRIFNSRNSKRVFDDFDFTGLNNFDFFSKGFFETGLEK